MHVYDTLSFTNVSSPKKRYYLNVSGAISNGNKKEISRLYIEDALNRIRMGEDINSTDDDGWTALHHAAR